MEANDKQVTQLIRSTHWSIFASKNVQFLLNEGQIVKMKILDNFQIKKNEKFPLNIYKIP